MASNNLITLMDSFFDDFRPLSTNWSRVVSTAPALNVKEYKDKYQITLTVPGLDPKKVKVELNDRVLNINYQHEEKDEEKDEEGELIRQEYKHYSFSRSVALPKNVDEESIEAECKNGILTINVKKSPESQPKTVNIKVS